MPLRIWACLWTLGIMNERVQLNWNGLLVAGLGVA